MSKRSAGATGSLSMDARRPRPRLTSTRLDLRPFVPADAPAVRELAGAREVASTTLTIPHPNSGRVLQKTGMRYEGRLRQHVLKWGVYEDIELYGIVRDDWAPDDAAGEGGEQIR